MRFALWGGLLGALIAAGFQIQTYEMLYERWIIITALGCAVVALVVCRPIVDRVKAMIHRPPRYR